MLYLTKPLMQGTPLLSGHCPLQQGREFLQKRRNYVGLKEENTRIS